MLNVGVMAVDIDTGFSPVSNDTEDDQDNAPDQSKEIFISLKNLNRPEKTQRHQ